MGGPEDLTVLASRCKEVNLATLRSAQAKTPRTEAELQLAKEAWAKVQKDISNGHAGTPIKVEQVDLESNLLVDTFGIYEKHAGSDWKVRVINNFRSNTVNQYAWMPSKMRYDGFGDVHHASRILKETWPQGLTLGKADFKSAFKTLPPNKAHKWLCWSLVYNTDIGDFVAVPIHSQAFGSLGAVVAWFRTVKMIQALMQNLLGLVLFSYVDDCFWITPAYNGIEEPGAHWFSLVFEYLVTDLLGWKLDPEKSKVGAAITLLGLDVEMGKDASCWSLGNEKAKEWIQEMKGILEANWLAPAAASKLCGKLGFLNAHIFNRLGRCLLRPIIWRQIQTVGSYTLTSRLRFSLIWFIQVLSLELRKSIPYAPRELEDTAILYSDAESTGYVACVLWSQKVRLCFHGSISTRLRQLLIPRATQIIPFELIAACAALLQWQELGMEKVGIRHFVDSKPARGIVVKGCSKQADLNSITGMLWYMAGKSLQDYWCDYVPSKLNLADDPSRRRFAVMKQLGFKLIDLDFECFAEAAETWLRAVEVYRLV